MSRPRLQVGSGRVQGRQLQGMPAQGNVLQGPIRQEDRRGQPHGQRVQETGKAAAHQRTRDDAPQQTSHRTRGRLRGHQVLNHGFRRFRLKSNRKVRVEFGLVALAHNLRKYSAILSERMMGGGILSMLQYRWPIQLHTDANNRDTAQKWFSVKGKTIIGCNLKKLQPIIVSIKANETDLKNPFWVGLFYNHRVPLY